MGVDGKSVAGQWHGKGERRLLGKLERGLEKNFF